ncbi:peptidase E [Streptosporangium sp. 'caverna']|uniref:Type 1 glutamine amidotransferase-like domain-containing protein n=1 Tax=Streptosporangium sp. 'caverna' TaxID=2202249 RepID=UPI000D7E6B8B|nr:peptidase E [Streptosporangium sp. 'caverna']AWS46858.1 peptidase E [Streptosporangium sp. 'caverna']
MVRERQILACSGVLNPPEDFPPERVGVQIWQAMRLTGVPRPRMCLIATAVGDSREYIDHWYARAGSFGDADLSHLELFVRPNVADVRAHLLAQDVIFVSGGSVVNLLAVWRAHRLDAILRECWEAGVVLAGQSAGSLCWHLGGVTDSFGDDLGPVDNGLGLLPFSNGVHDDLDDQPRRRRFRELVGKGDLPSGYATEDGVALHYVGTRLHEVLGVLPDRHAWFVESDGAGQYREKALPARHWLP